MECKNEDCILYTKSSVSGCRQLTSSQIKLCKDNPENEPIQLESKIKEGEYIPDEVWDEMTKPFVAKDTLGNLVAAKVLLGGISKSATKRDGKSLSEIIDGLDYIVESSGITKQDLINVSEMTLKKIFKEK